MQDMDEPQWDWIEQHPEAFIWTPVIALALVVAILAALLVLL